MKSKKNESWKTKDEILRKKAVDLTRRVERDHKHLDALGQRVMKSLRRRRRTSVARQDSIDQLSLDNRENAPVTTA